jgi:phosphoesterase RecJ-like protein
MKKHKEEFKKTEQLIKESKRILLAGHVRPDGDSLGSLLGMASAIKDNLNKEIIAYSTDEIPHSLTILTGIGTLTSEIKQKPDLVIGFDYSDFERLALPEDKISGAKIITFDHHPLFNQRGDVKIVDTEFSSTAELVWEFLKATGWKISKNTATNILTGIVTDTGGFSRASSSTLKNAAELVEKRAPLEQIYIKSFSHKSVHVMKIWGELLKNSLFYSDYELVSVFVPYAKYKKYGTRLDELQGIVNELRSVDEARFALFAVEHERGKIKGSLRSDRFKNFDVLRIAKKFGGGGHKYAAGFDYEGSIEKLKKDFLETVSKQAR